MKTGTFTNNRWSITVLFSVLLWGVIMVPFVAHGVSVDSPLTARTIEGLLRSLIAIVLVFATPLIIFFIIFAGAKYVFARGNEEEIRKANRALLYAVIGGLLVLGAFILIDIIANLIASLRGPE